MCITESLCYTAEIGTNCKSNILQSKKKFFKETKNEMRTVSDTSGTILNMPTFTL